MTRRMHGHRIWQEIVQGACLLAVVALLWPSGMVGAADQVPVLTLEPERGSCASPLVIRGTDFPPGQVVDLTAGAARTDVVRRLARPTVAPDGTFIVRVEMWQLEATCRFPPEQRVADGTPYTILASVGGDSPGTLLAGAVFVLAESDLPGAAAGGPTLALTPDRGPCATALTIRGAGFPPDQAVELTGYAGSLEAAPRFAGPTADAVGAFTVRVELRELAPSCGVAGGPPSSRTPIHTILATPPGQARPALAGAFFLLTEVPRPPTLVVEPDRGPCATELTIRGAGFFPLGQVITLTARAGRDDPPLRFASPTVGADGAFELRAAALSLTPACRDGDGPREGEEIRYTILAVIGDGQRAFPEASASFILTGAPAPLPGLPNTGGGGAALRAPLLGGWLVAVGGAALLGGMLGCARVRRRARS